MKKTELEVLLNRLEKAIPAGEWKKILEVMDIIGIVDNRQLQGATGLGRDKVRRTLEKMETASDARTSWGDANGCTTATPGSGTQAAADWKRGCGGTANNQQE